MTNNNLSLDIGSNISLRGLRFTITGYIVFKDCEGTTWTEYKLKSKERFQTRWLTVDPLNNEYAVYSEESYSEEFSEENISANGYKQVDSKTVRVVDYKGNIDVDLGEKVTYKEYEDSTELLLLSIAEWDEELEYSKGHYIDYDEIEVLDKQKVGTSTIMGIVLIVIFGIFLLKTCVINNMHDNSLSRIISTNGNFWYQTSITSDLDEGSKADIYSTPMTIKETTQLLMDANKPAIIEVEENEEDDTVVIVTKDEMAVIYLSEDLQTLIQVSSREYVYSSRSGLYMGRGIANQYYRGYYFSRWYKSDRNRYRHLANGYSDLDPTYSNSIRQSSTNSRPSSGDGISSGK